MSKTYQWFVTRGRVSIHSEASIIVLGLDPEGSAYCVLSVRDALELAQIIGEEARKIWEKSGPAVASQARIEGDVREACTLSTEPGLLKAIAHDSQPLIALMFDSGTECRLDVTRAVALVQILQYMCDAIGSRMSSAT